MRCNFRVMKRLGDSVMRPFLQASCCLRHAWSHSGSVPDMITPHPGIASKLSSRGTCTRRRIMHGVVCRSNGPVLRRGSSPGLVTMRLLHDFDSFAEHHSPARPVFPTSACRTPSCGGRWRRPCSACSPRTQSPSSAACPRHGTAPLPLDFTLNLPSS